MERDYIVCKWTLSILSELYISPKRPSQLLKSIKGISERVLYDRLNKLTKNGVLEKISNSTYPMISYYKLKNPEEFKPIVELIINSDIDKNEIVSLLTCKWTFSIMKLIEKEEKSPKSIKANLQGISDKILYQRLNTLLEKNLARRVVYSVKPVEVKYVLTENGKKVLKYIEKLNLSLSKVGNIENDLSINLK